jgi:hypothetical protein
MEMMWLLQGGFHALNHSQKMNCSDEEESGV